MNQPQTLQALETIPLLRIFDVAKAHDFYVGFLGFEVDWEHRFDDTAPLYQQVSRAGCVLHLTEHHGDCTPGSTVFVRVVGLDGYHAELMAKGYGFMKPTVEDMPWGARQMEVIDPFGNRLRFNEDVDES